MNISNSCISDSTRIRTPVSAVEVADDSDDEDDVC